MTVETDERAGGLQGLAKAWACGLTRHPSGVAALKRERRAGEDLSEVTLKGSRHDPSTKETLSGCRRNQEGTIGRRIDNEVCLFCGDELGNDKKDDHMIGRKHGELVWPLHENCRRKRPPLQREEPPPTDHPRNVFEVIGRWHLSVAEYFELMCDTFRRFGEYLIETRQTRLWSRPQVVVQFEN